MTPADIGLHRLAQQRLAGNHFATPEEVVGWLGAVQSQEYLGAVWSLGMRMGNGMAGGATDEVIERAFTEGTILRTHVMRPTWHFVTPADIRWLLDLTAPRVQAATAYYYRQAGLDDETVFARSNEVITRALEGGKHLTRAELGAALQAAGINVADRMRLQFIVGHAELDALICSGPRRGKQFTYALLAERAPQARTLPRDEALAELTRRYFTSHGPATARDFAWWSGLTMADARTGLEMVGADLSHEEIAGQTYWFPASLPPLAPESPELAFLLPTYDEFLVGYDGFGAALTGGRGNGERTTFSATVVIGGRVVGNWRRAIIKGAVVIELAPFAPLSTSEREAVFAASRYGAFLGMSVECVGL